MFLFLIMNHFNWDKTKRKADVFIVTKGIGSSTNNLSGPTI